jgi:serine/threonine-protein kinase HipA
VGRASHSRALSIWTNGQRVGTWRIPARGEMELRYDADWMKSPAGRPLSLSLPFGVDTSPLKGEKVANFFDNLLPDSIEIRKRLASQFKTGSTEAFALLAALGRDCVGAVQLLPEEALPDGYDRIEGTPLSEEEVAQHLEAIVAGPGKGFEEAEREFRISIAGAQEKTALLWHEGRWLRPHGATPTTHILKLPIGLVGNRRADLTTSVENEWLCMHLLEAFGLNVAKTAILEFAGRRVLGAERFDRQMHSSGGWLLRRPQEDFCQALGRAAADKYEAEGGPGMQDIARLLQSSERARDDLQTLMTAQLLFWMLAATDGHAKNFSVHLLAGGRYHLTPLYDVVSIWPIVGDSPNQVSWHREAKLAMSLRGKNKHYLLKEIRRRHFNTMAARCGYGPNAESLIQELVERTPAAIDEVKAKLPAGFPERVATAIFHGLSDSAERLEKMSATD